MAHLTILGMLSQRAWKSAARGPPLRWPDAWQEGLGRLDRSGVGDRTSNRWPAHYECAFAECPQIHRVLWVPKPAL